MLNKDGLEHAANYGAVAFLEENDDVIAILNHRSLLDIVEAAG